MLILIEADNGEQYEDYQNWIEKVYDIPNHTNESLQKDYLDFIQKEMLKSNIIVNPYYPRSIMIDSICQDKKLHRKILYKNNIYFYIEKILGATPVKFGTLHDPC